MFSKTRMMKTNHLPAEELTAKDLLLGILQILNANKPSDSLYYDNADLKQILHISDRTIYRLRKKNQIDFIRLGGKYFYPKSFFKKLLPR